MKLWVIRAPIAATTQALGRVRSRRMMPQRNNCAAASAADPMPVPRRPRSRPRGGPIPPSVARSIPF